MSETADFYLSWLGCGAFGANSLKVKDIEPIIFKPTDISGCRIWFDANNSASINANEFGTVFSWMNLGTLGGQFDLSGGADIQTGVNTVNNLNVVSFTNNAYMTGNFQLNFQERSVFLVVKQKSDLSGNVNALFSSDATNGMEIFTLTDASGTTFFIGKHPSPVPTLAFSTPLNFIGSAVLTEFINASDLSGNWMGYNGEQRTPTYEVIASGYNTSNIEYFLGGYFGGTALPGAEDYCEMIIYEGALPESERKLVETYLITKWNLITPAPPPPPPFTPTDYSGLYLWLDANQPSTITLGTSNDVVGWSNIGLAGTTFAPGCNTAVYAKDSNGNYFVGMGSGTLLETYMSLPYYSRTQFIVMENLADFTATTYPYQNFLVGNASAGVQTGFVYDSNSVQYFISMCQSGVNCPVGGVIPTIPIGGYNLGIWSVDSNDYTSTVAYFNGGSNRNTSTDLGNVFNTFPIPYSLGSPVYDSPAYRLCEVIEYDSRLSFTQISTVANYLVNKWAISSFSTLV